MLTLRQLALATSWATCSSRDDSMQMVLFHGVAEIEGNTYVETQVVTFSDEVSVDAWPCRLIATAPVFVDHVPRVTEES